MTDSSGGTIVRRIEDLDPAVFRHPAIWVILSVIASLLLCIIVAMYFGPRWAARRRQEHLRERRQNRARGHDARHVHASSVSSWWSALVPLRIRLFFSRHARPNPPASLNPNRNADIEQGLGSSNRDYYTNYHIISGLHSPRAAHIVDGNVIRPPLLAYTVPRSASHQARLSARLRDAAAARFPILARMFARQQAQAQAAPVDPFAAADAMIEGMRVAVRENTARHEARNNNYNNEVRNYDNARAARELDGIAFPPPTYHTAGETARIDPPIENVVRVGADVVYVVPQAGESAPRYRSPVHGAPVRYESAAARGEDGAAPARPRSIAFDLYSEAENEAIRAQAEAEAARVAAFGDAQAGGSQARQGPIIGTGVRPGSPYPNASAVTAGWEIRRGFAYVNGRREDGWDDVELRRYRH